MSELIEVTGYSYSGVSDLIRNSEDPETEAYHLLSEVDREYNLIKAEIKRLEEKVNKKHTQLRFIVSMFLHVHKVMELKEDLVYQLKDKVVTVKLLNEGSIEYSKIELTDFSKINK